MLTDWNEHEVLAMKPLAYTLVAPAFCVDAPLASRSQRKENLV